MKSRGLIRMSQQRVRTAWWGPLEESTRIVEKYWSSEGRRKYIDLRGRRLSPRAEWAVEAYYC